MFIEALLTMGISAIAKQQNLSVEAILTLSISVIALGVSIYGAVLATQVKKRERERDQREVERDQREIQRDRKRIRIFLDSPFAENAELTIVNVGHRPITINSLYLIPEGY